MNHDSLGTYDRDILLLLVSLSLLLKCHYSESFFSVSLSLSLMSSSSSSFDFSSLRSFLSLEEGRLSSAPRTSAGAQLDKLWLGSQPPPQPASSSTASSFSFSSLFSSSSVDAPSSSDNSPNNTKSWLSLDTSSVPFLSSASSTPPSSSFSCFTLDWTQRLILFSLSLFAGLLMLGLSFTFLPGILLGGSAKFALSYALSNVFLLFSSVFLVGIRSQFESMTSNNRTLISSVYLFSLLSVIYCSIAFQSMFLIVPLLIIQFLALLSYVLSYFPYGVTAAKGMWKFVARKVGIPV
jgi:hypothetical protein